MANIKSAKKRAKTNEIRRKRNVDGRSDIKSDTNRFLSALESKDLAGAKELLKDVESKVSRASGKGLLKGNTAGRKVSRLAKRLAAASR